MITLDDREQPVIAELLESLVFAKRAAKHITEKGSSAVIDGALEDKYDRLLKEKHDYFLLRDDYVSVMRSEIEKAREAHLNGK